MQADPYRHHSLQSFTAVIHATLSLRHCPAAFHRSVSPQRFTTAFHRSCSLQTYDQPRPVMKTDTRHIATSHFTPRIKTSLLILALASLTACSSDNDDAPAQVTPDGQYAYVATRAAAYGSGRVDRLSLAEGNTVDASYRAASSDIGIDTDGVNLYQLGRSQSDSITRYDARDTSIVDYQYSVNDESTTAANPQDLAFVDEGKAYLTRRGSDALWIINPSAESEAEFKLGEIDLSAYNTDLPFMTDAIIVGDKLFVLLERLMGPQQVADKAAYIAVFDTATDTEIDTGQGSNGLKGIELDVRNPTALQYNEETQQIYVVGRGNFFESTLVEGDFHTGGIVEIDPTTYEHTLLIDDGTDADNQGYFVDIRVIDANLGYLLTYESFGVSTLRTFSPLTGTLTDAVIPELEDVDITTLAEGPDDHLWVGINDATPGFYRIDLATGELAQDRVATKLVPMSVQFIDLSSAPD